MLLNNSFQTDFQTMPNLETPPKSRLEFGRLISAAVVNKSFRKQLIDDPIKAVESGYYGQAFFFTAEEKTILASIKAIDLQDFAATLLKIQNQKPISEKVFEPAAGCSKVNLPS